MPSQFNITFTSVTLKCNESELDPTFKIIFPDLKKYKSKGSIQNIQGDYMWQDRATFAYLSERNHRLDKYFVRIALHGKNKEFIGDTEIDMLTLVTGPMKFDLSLQHGMSNCRVTFICSCNEYIKSSIKIENFEIGNMDSGNLELKSRIFSKPESSATMELIKEENKYLQINECILSEVVSYKDLQTDMELEIYDKNSKEIYESVRFGIHTLYDKEKLIYEFTTATDKPVKLEIELIDKPIYVQSLSGTYHGFGRYTNFVQLPGTYYVDTSSTELIKYNEPIAQPSEGCVKVFKPFTSKVIFKKLTIIGSNLPDNVFIKVRNTVNTKREKMTLNRSGDVFTVEDYRFIPFEISRPYQLNRRYLILELCTEDGEYLGDIYLNLHNLFAGPPKYIVDFICIPKMDARAEIDLDVINGRTMKVKFSNFRIEDSDQLRNCYLKFGFDASELKFDDLTIEDNYINYAGEYEVNIFYSTASKNIQQYVINVMLMESKFLRDNVKFQGKYPLMKILPFKTKKDLIIPFEQANVQPFKCTITMATSLTKPGLYGEYILLKEGTYDNGFMDLSTFKESEAFTEFSQPLYFPTIVDSNYQPKEEPSQDNLDKTLCSVLTGCNNEEQVYVLLTDTDITITKLDGTMLITHPINTDMTSTCNNNQLTIITPNHHTQLYTTRSMDIKKWIDSHIVEKPEVDKSKDAIGYYCLCSTDCRGAISVTCPVCNYHPMDFSLFNYSIAHCDTCEFETYLHFKDNENIEMNCPMCETQLRVLNDTTVKTFICSCGFPLGSQCKRCEKIPEFDNPKVYIRKSCGECGQVQLINESITNDVNCAKCKAPIDVGL